MASYPISSWILITSLLLITISFAPTSGQFGNFGNLLGGGGGNLGNLGNSVGNFATTFRGIKSRFRGMRSGGGAGSQFRGMGNQFKSMFGFGRKKWKKKTDENLKYNSYYPDDDLAWIKLIYISKPIFIKNLFYKWNKNFLFK